MNKKQAQERLCAIETEAEKLRRIIDEPEARKPEVGDIIEAHGWTLLVDQKGGTTALVSNYPEKFPVGGNEANYSSNTSDNNLGKFDEVYIKISDVRDALSIEDKGDSKNSVMSFLFRTDRDPLNETVIETVAALRKLSIIKD